MVQYNLVKFLCLVALPGSSSMTASRCQKIPTGIAVECQRRGHQEQGPCESKYIFPFTKRGKLSFGNAAARL